MLASSFVSPKLSKDAVSREINAIESEFQMCYPEDIVRQVQVMQMECHHDDHILKRFMWGNKESLADESGTLWNELR